MPFHCMFHGLTSRIRKARLNGVAKPISEAMDVRLACAQSLCQAPVPTSHANAHSQCACHATQCHTPPMPMAQCLCLCSCPCPSPVSMSAHLLLPMPLHLPCPSPRPLLNPSLPPCHASRAQVAMMTLVTMMTSMPTMAPPSSYARSCLRRASRMWRMGGSPSSSTS